MIRENVELTPLTYYKIGGQARYLAQPESTLQLAEVAAFLREKKLNYFILGAGSNVLFDDAGFDGLILHTAKLDRGLTVQNCAIEVGASVMAIQVVRACMSNGITGFEFLVGVPGNMGGVFYMNAGTKAGEAKDVTTEITAFDLSSAQERKIPQAELKYSYRKNHFLKPHEVIVRGQMAGKPMEPKLVQSQVQALLDARKRTQPIDKPSCGSVFKNPDLARGIHAGSLIERAGLKGHKIGGAQISPMHANFIVNLGSAKAADVRALIDEAKSIVLKKFSVKLEEEVRIVPRDGGSAL